MRGKLIAFEGIDGVGKNTQLKLFSDFLKSKNIAFKNIAFPRHGNSAAYFVDKYLSTDHPYGKLSDIGAYESSLFYTLDRYDAKFELTKWLDDGFMVIADRYIGSNVGHQGGKLNSDEEKIAYIDWLYDLEHKKLGIPKPVFSVVLWLPVEIAIAQIEGRGNKKDGHEADANHLKRAQASYLWAAKHYPKEFKVVKCFEDDRILSESEVHAKVLELIKNEIGI